MKMKAMLPGLLILGFGMSAVAQSEPSTAAAHARELQSRYMTGVRAELVTKIDTKSAAPGQVIAVKTKADVTLADGKMIPAGTKLMGRVMSVRKSDEQTGSAVTLNFDQAVLKDGTMLPVRSLLRTLGTSAGAGAGVDPMAQPIEANDGGLSGTGIGGVTRGGVNNGGRNGGMGGGATGGIGPTRGGRQTNPIGTGIGAAAPEATAQVDRRTVDAGESVTNRPRQTGVPGVLLATSPSDETSGTLMEYGKNIVLDGGTQITLGLIAR